MSIEKPNKPVLTEEDLEYICDSVCRYPYISTSEEELKKYCEGCVITKKLKEEMNTMAKNKEIKKETEEMKDAREFVEMYAKLNTADKYQVKGIMIGLQIRDKMEKAVIAS